MVKRKQCQSLFHCTHSSVKRAWISPSNCPGQQKHANIPTARQSKSIGSISLQRQKNSMTEGQLCIQFYKSKIKNKPTLSKREIFMVLSVAASSITGGPSSNTLRRNSFVQSKQNRVSTSHTVNHVGDMLIISFLGTSVRSFLSP